MCGLPLIRPGLSRAIEIRETVSVAVLEPWHRPAEAQRATVHVVQDTVGNANAGKGEYFPFKWLAVWIHAGPGEKLVALQQGVRRLQQPYGRDLWGGERHVVDSHDRGSWSPRTLHPLIHGLSHRADKRWGQSLTSQPRRSLRQGIRQSTRDVAEQGVVRWHFDSRVNVLAVFRRWACMHRGATEDALFSSRRAQAGSRRS